MRITAVLCHCDGEKYLSVDLVRKRRILVSRVALMQKTMLLKLSGQSTAVLPMKMRFENIKFRLHVFSPQISV